MTPYPKLLTAVIHELGKLPGVGPKTAERLAFYLLKLEDEEAYQLSEAIRKLKAEALFCSICQNLTELNPCEICADPERDLKTVLVVEQPKDLIAFEKAGIYHGRYHVLLGHIAPLEGEDLPPLALRNLRDRVKREKLLEIIIATNPTLEGDGTALYIAKSLEGAPPVKITRIAKGIASGTTIDYANKAILFDAFTGRQVITIEKRETS
ncbi:MAG: recombination mediator RecR [Planctomycetota bacterium]